MPNASVRLAGGGNVEKKGPPNGMVWTRLLVTYCQKMRVPPVICHRSVACRLSSPYRARSNSPDFRAYVYMASTGFSALGGVPWIVFWGVLGRAIGSHYHSVQSNLHYVDITAVVIIAAAIGVLIVRRRRRTVAA